MKMSPDKTLFSFFPSTNQTNRSFIGRTSFYIFRKHLHQNIKKPIRTVTSIIDSPVHVLRCFELSLTKGHVKRDSLVVTPSCSLSQYPLRFLRGTIPYLRPLESKVLDIPSLENVNSLYSFFQTDRTVQTRKLCFLVTVPLSSRRLAGTRLKRPRSLFGLVHERSGG